MSNRIKEGRAIKVLNKRDDVAPGAGPASENLLSRVDRKDSCLLQDIPRG
jgi:hypothetical protein